MEAKLISWTSYCGINGTVVTTRISQYRENRNIGQAVFKKKRGMKSTPVLYTGNFLPVYTIFRLIFLEFKVWGVDLHFRPTYIPFFTVL